MDWKLVGWLVVWLVVALLAPLARREYAEKALRRLRERGLRPDDLRPKPTAWYCLLAGVLFFVLIIGSFLILRWFFPNDIHLRVESPLDAVVFGSFALLGSFIAGVSIGRGWYGYAEHAYRMAKKAEGDGSPRCSRPGPAALAADLQHSIHEMKEEPYPYNLPPWRGSHAAISRDGQWHAEVKYAPEIYMGGPTKGPLSIDGIFEIPDCSPTFMWSKDSRYLAVPQWKYWFRRRQRVLIIDIQERQIFASPAHFRLLVLEHFENGVITGTDSPIWKARQVQIRMDQALKTYKRIEQGGGAYR